jgi:hypothetical protein
MAEHVAESRFILALLEVVRGEDGERHVKPVKRFDLRDDDIGPSAAFMGMVVQLAFDHYVRWRDTSYPRGEVGRAQFVQDAAAGEWPECYPLLLLFEALVAAYRRQGHRDNPMDSLRALYAAQAILADLPVDLFDNLDAGEG